MEQPFTPHSPILKALQSAGPRAGPLRLLHARIIVSGLHHSLPVLTNLLTSLSTASPSPSPAYLLRILSSIPRPDAFLFDSLIRAASRSSLPSVALLAYRRRIRLRNLPLSNYTLTAVIRSCALLSASRTGRQIHAHAVALGFASDRFVQSALVAFYAKSGDPSFARQVFDGIPDRNIIAWNTMISGYEQNGLAEEAVELFLDMREANVEPDSATLVSVLSACAQSGASELGNWVHDYIVNRALPVDVVLGTSLVNMHVRCGNLSEARRVFDWMPERNVVAWTSMISGYGIHGCGCEAVELFKRMRSSEGAPRPNDVTFVAVLSACAHAGLVEEGREAYACMEREYGIVPQSEHHVCMVDMYARAGLLYEAKRFVEVCVHGEPAPAVWTAMMGACWVRKEYGLGADVAERLLEVEPDHPGHYVMLSNMFALAGRGELVEAVRRKMVRKRLKKLVGYSSVEIDGAGHVFRMGDRAHPWMGEIRRCLEGLAREMREAGCAVRMEEEIGLL
ncbi:Pentatricopeptide repeat-containing protein [Acorus calamus]|uniref:Pentatricopeptide repeat-containing protein n=1 Tax=Acorus calamus TaxID=4465 RepID=A0AAV9DN45_ACOCL|nr:Pentatricopeptide repeat-containing protein [Acorus calamus]